MEAWSDVLGLEKKKESKIFKWRNNKEKAKPIDMDTINNSIKS